LVIESLLLGFENYYEIVQAGVCFPYSLLQPSECQPSM